MAYLYRLITTMSNNRFAFVLFVIIIMSLASSANAETIPKSTVRDYIYNAQHYTTADAYCNAFYQHQIQPLVSNGTYPNAQNLGPNAGESQCRYSVTTGGQVFTYSIGYTETNTCPASYTDIGNNQCYRADCAAGQVRDEAGVCQSDCNSPARDLTGQPYGGAGSLPSSVCVAGCTYPIVNGATAHKKDGTSFFEGTVGAASGGNCTGQEATNKNDTNRTPEEKCLSGGQGFITTNGTTTCVPAGTGGSPQIVIKDSTKSNTTPTGTSTQQTTTTVNNGQVTTTTQTTDANGQTTTQTQTQSQQSFCQENPNSQICKAAERGNFSGSCTAGFICSSPDAATCATAMLAHQSRCQDTVENDSTGLGKSLIAGTDVQANDPRAEGNITTINVASFDATAGPVGAGGCITDRVVSMGQGSITLPFSKLCPYINMLGYALLSIAWITAGRIVGKA